MIERFTLKVPHDAVAVLVDRFARVALSIPGVADPVNLERDQCQHLARMAVESLSPQVQVNWGAHRVETNEVAK